jgi:hypothetical protein
LSSDQLDKLIDREAGIGDNAPKCAWANTFVVWNDDARVRRFAAKDHMAAGLPPEYKSDALQRGANIAA